MLAMSPGIKYSTSKKTRSVPVPILSGQLQAENSERITVKVTGGSPDPREALGLVLKRPRRCLVFVLLSSVNWAALKRKTFCARKAQGTSSKPGRFASSKCREFRHSRSTRNLCKSYRAAEAAAATTLCERRPRFVAASLCEAFRRSESAPPTGRRLQPNKCDGHKTATTGLVHPMTAGSRKGGQ